MPRPALLPDAARAFHAWRWCGGWRPERLPLYLAAHPVPDADLLIDLLLVLRDELESPPHG